MSVLGKEGRKGWCVRGAESGSFHSLLASPGVVLHLESIAGLSAYE